MPRILIVDSNPSDCNARQLAGGGDAAGQGYARALAACDPHVETEIIAPYDGDRAGDLSVYDGVVFTGSAVEWSTQDDRVEPLAAIMRATFALGIPVLGSCNGMQLAASVLGGETGESPNGNEVGLARDVRMTEDGLRHPYLKGREQGYAVPCVHRDEVRRLPEGAVLLAGNAHSPVQAFAYEKDGIRFWGSQYHPEFVPGRIGPYLAGSGRLDPDQGALLAVADHDADAAERLGVRAGELAAPVRMLELANWLASLSPVNRTRTGAMQAP